MVLLRDFFMENHYWFVYMTRCVDASLFTGVTDDVKKAVETQNQGRGPAYTRCRRPCFLAYTEEYMNREDAERRAEEIRAMTREEKEDVLTHACVTRISEPAYA